MPRQAQGDWQRAYDFGVAAWGGPVVSDDGKVYFAASIWPFMGTYIWCLDAASGDIAWVNDSTATQYIKQPHSAPSFAGVCPQGGLVVVGDYLLVPGGRSVPHADRNTGELRHFLLNEGGKGNGGSLVLGRGSEFYVHTRRSRRVARLSWRAATKRRL